MKEGYKKTELGIFPKEWITVELNELIKDQSVYEILDGNHGALYPRNEEFIESGVSYISANSIYRNKIDFSKAKFLSIERANKFRKGVARNGDVLFAHNATVGPVALLETTEEKVILSTSLTYYRVNKDKIHNKYLMYFMSSNLFSKQYEKRMGQTTRNQVPITVQKELMHVIPPLKEQEKIAEILSAVDSQIDDTDKLIEKTKVLKKGLMQRLLTKGIGHTEFKKTEVGEIPVEWRVKTLEDISANYKNSIVDGPFGSNLKTCDYTEKGTLVMQSSYITSGKFELKDVRYISEDKAKELSRSSAKSGDLLMAKIGANFGAVEIIPKEIEYGILSSNSLKIDLDVEVAINEFYLYILKNYRDVGVISKLASVTAQPALSLKAIKELKVVVPSIQEQKKISQILSSVDTRIEEYENKKMKLEELKKGLMQQLLTGNIRVK